MAKNTHSRIEANLASPEFNELLEEAKDMVQQGQKAEAAYHILKDMNLKKDENNISLFFHIPDRQLAELLGVGKTLVSNQRQRLIQERSGVARVVNNINDADVKILGKGRESVYLYYFPTYQLYCKFVHEVPDFPCNIGRTTGDVTDRIRDQIGQQLPEKPKIALILKTNDCKALETEIHNMLKRRQCWLDPNSGANVIGTEWFFDEPVDVEELLSLFSSKNRL